MLLALLSSALAVSSLVCLRATSSLVLPLIALVCSALLLLYCINLVVILLFIYTMMYGCMVYYGDDKCTAINLTVRLSQTSAVVWLSELTYNN